MHGARHQKLRPSRLRSPCFFGVTLKVFVILCPAMIARLKDRWTGQGGCADVLRLAFPLILSTSAHTLHLFVDSVFLMWYARNAMAAAVQAGLASFSVVSFFLGVASYTNTFVAQYSGAGRPRRVGPAVWQGIYFSLAAALVVLCFIPAAKTIFAWVGHEQMLQELEIRYFRILCLAAGPMLISASVSSFFTGRGKTWTVMCVNVSSAAINVALDYCLIFGRFGLPRLGIAGAAWGTVLAAVFSAVAFLVLFLLRPHRRTYDTLLGLRPDARLFARLMRYGLPSGVQFMLDILAFNIFMVLVGRIDPAALAATSMAFRINMLAFMPMIGIGIAVSTLVGQALGGNRPSLAQRTTWSAFFLTFGYMTIIAAGYWLRPGLFIWPFAALADASEFAAMRPVVVRLLCFVAFYCLFDTGNIIFAAALKGAGDTRFVMLIALGLSWAVMVVPTYLALRWNGGLYAAWSFATAYVCTLAVAFLLRFLSGKWKSMRVIEAVHPPTGPGTMEIPTVE